MDKYNGKSFGDAMPSFDYVYSGQKERDNQPIEEKIDKIVTEGYRLGHLAIPSGTKWLTKSLENLLEQERKIMAGAIEMSKLGWIDEGRIEERKRMSEEIEKRKMDGYCKDENCSHDECGTIRWFNKGLNISLSIINK